MNSYSDSSTRYSPFIFTYFVLEHPKTRNLPEGEGSNKSNGTVTTFYQTLENNNKNKTSNRSPGISSSPSSSSSLQHPLHLPRPQQIPIPIPVPFSLFFRLRFFCKTYHNIFVLSLGWEVVVGCQKQSLTL